MAKTFKFIVIALISVFDVNGCKKRGESDLKHDINQPVRSNVPWQWKDLSFDQYKEVVAPSYDIDPANIIADPSNPLVKRGNFWVSQIDEQLRKRFPGELASVPVPRAVVVKDKDANAFVSGVSICVAIPTILNPELPETKDSTIAAVELSTDGFRRPDNDESPCVQQKFDKNLMEQIIEWFNHNNQSCKMRLIEERGNFRLSAAENCKQDSSLTGVSRATASRFTVTNNWITLNTGLFAQFPDKEWMIIPTITHELGHYYRSHMTVFDSEYDYFYKIGNQNSNRKPMRDRSLDERGLKVSQAQRLSEMAEPFSKQIYHPGVFIIGNKIVRSMCGRKSQDCVRQCATLDKKITNGYWAQKLGDYPDNNVDNKKRGFLKEYESLLQSCASSIVVVNGYERRGVANLELDNALSDFKYFVTVPQAKKLNEVLTDFSSQLNDAQTTAKEVVAAAERDGLAKYTVEAEADEFGLEQFIHLGFNTSDWITADFVFNKNPDADEEEKRSFEECFSAFQRGWKTEGGQPFLPERGGFYDPHQKPCFRSVNMAREAEAHKYESLKTDPWPLMLSDKEWRSISALARSIEPEEGSAESSSQLHFVHPWKSPLYGCFYRRVHKYGRSAQ